MAAKRKKAAGERAPRPRGTHGRQRQRLIDACISALHIYGPSRTTVAKVVAIAKMSPGIVRFYFDSKAAMLVASLQYLAAEFEEQLLVPVTKLRARPVAALELMVDLYLDPDIASPRKVSVWYAFWGEASSRQEYYDICGQKDASFAVLVQELIGRLIEETAQPHLDPGAIALGLIGVLEVLWQDFAFQSEGNIDRRAAKARAMAYLRSVFPGQFDAKAPAAPAAAARSIASFPSWTYHSERAFAMERDLLFKHAWHIAAHASQLPMPGDYCTLDAGADRVIVVRDGNGALRALRNSCPQWPHVLLTERAGRLPGVIECPIHGLAFELTGAPRAPEGAALSALELRTVAGWLLVRASKSAGEEGALPAAVGKWLEEQGRAAAPRLMADLERDVAADWKVLIEQWLEAAPPGHAGAGMLQWRSDAPAPGAGWSAQCYRRLAAVAGPWQEGLLAPNQWVQSRPDGFSLWQAIASGPGCCRLRERHYAYGAQAKAARALQYLASRLRPLGRRAMLAGAQSAQQGVVRFGYRASPAPSTLSAAGWFRAQLMERIPALAQGRPPADS